MNRAIDQLLAAISVNDNPNLHFIDVENIAGNGHLTLDAVAKVKAAYEETVFVTPGDLICVASGIHNTRAVREGWPGAAYSFRKGKDGADLALLSIFEGIESLNHFGHIFLASGDGGLLEIAQRSSFQGKTITVVARANGCSKKFTEYSPIYLKGESLK